MQRCGEGRVARDHEREAARATDAGEVAAKRRTVGCTVVTEDDAGETTWQAGGSRTWIRQPESVGEQPERRDLGMKASDGRIRPGQDARIHLAIAVA